VVEGNGVGENTPRRDSLWAPTLRESAHNVSLGERVGDRYDVQLHWVPSRSYTVDVFWAGCTAVGIAELGRGRIDSGLSLASDCV
jgi:hypothetical protein